MSPREHFFTYFNLSPGPLCIISDFAGAFCAFLGSTLELFAYFSRIRQRLFLKESAGAYCVVFSESAGAFSERRVSVTFKEGRTFTLMDKHRQLNSRLTTFKQTKIWEKLVLQDSLKNNKMLRKTYGKQCIQRNDNRQL
jgi:hypothetical protein